MKKNFNSALHKTLLVLILMNVFCFPVLSEKLTHISPYKFPQKGNMKCSIKPKFLRISQNEWCQILNATHTAVKKEGLSQKLGYKKAMSIMLGLIYKESSFRERVRGKAGEIGLTQIMPSTGRFICKMNENELQNMSNNLNCSAKYINLLLSEDYFNKNLNDALMAYNQGWGNVKEGIIYDDDIRYVNLIVNEYSPIFMKNL
ncbi:MAG: lytic transglycosylase domain-containing protein [Candidatus Caenarcaniphilales bacterium]|nr:lytic transglycosylase domain-containing protein [Candidatus Caenarcaniphilales bacterium]